MNAAMLVVLAAILAAGAALMLRLAWKRRENPRDQLALTLLGWLTALACAVTSSLAIGAETGVVVALILFGIAGLVIAFANARWRNVRLPRDDIALAPSQRGARIWRGVFRFMLAGPISGAAAIGVALAFTLKAPLGEVDKLILGGSLVPLLWGAGMAWTLADDRILRAAAALLATGAAGFAIGVI